MSSIALVPRECAGQSFPSARQILRNGRSFCRFQKPAFEVMPGNNRVSRPGIMFEIGFKRREEVMRGIIEGMKRAVVFCTKTFRLWRRDNLHFAGLKPRDARDRELAVSHQYLTDGVRNYVFARDGRNARTQLLHVAFFDAFRRGQGFQSKDGGRLVPVVAVEAAKARGLSRAARTRPVQNGFPLALRLTHSCRSIGAIAQRADSVYYRPAMANGSRAGPAISSPVRRRAARRMRRKAQRWDAPPSRRNQIITARAAVKDCEATAGGGAKASLTALGARRDKL